MTDTAPGALDTVRLIQKATGQATRWALDEAGTRTALMGAMPQGVAGAYTPMEWMATVAVFRTEGEAPIQAAERLAKYLLTYQETTGRFPTLEAVQ